MSIIFDYLKKNRILAIGVLVLVLIVLLLFYLRSTTQKTPSPTPNTMSVLPTPFDSSLKNLDIPIDFQLQQSANFPTTLPVYSTTVASISLDEAQKTATQLGFTEKPSRLSDKKEGVVYVWSESSVGYMRVVPSKNSIDFKPASLHPIDNSGSFPSDKEIKEKAKQILNTYGFISNENPLIDPSIVYLELGDTEEAAAVAREQANVASVRFQELVGSYPIINTQPGIGTITVNLFKDLNVFSVYIERSGALTKVADYTVKTLDEIKNTPSKEFKIISLDNNNTDPRFIDINLMRSIRVDTIRIAYIRNPQGSRQLLQPIFALFGQVTLSSGRTVSVLLYLPATKS